MPALVGTAGGSGSVEMQQDQVKGEYLEAGFSGDQEGLESWEDLEEAEDEVVSGCLTFCC